MSSCAEFSDDRVLAAYEEPTGPSFPEHVRTCGACRDEVERIREWRGKYRRHDAEERMPERMRERLVLLARSNRTRRLRRALAAAAAAFAAVLALGWVMAHSQLPPPSSATAQATVAGRWEQMGLRIEEEIARIDQEVQWQELVLDQDVK